MRIKVLKDLKVKKMNAPKAANFKSGIALNNYLIQEAGHDNFLIHREISSNERKYYKDDRLFKYEGKTYLWGIANCPSEEYAQVAVNGYWDCVKQLAVK
jgi:hypothetical protein